MTSLLTAQPAPDVARRTWPRYAALGVALIAVAGAGALWSTGARLLLAALGIFLVGRGVVLLRGARSGALEGELGERARRLGPAAVLAGAVALLAGLVPGSPAGSVLLVGVPLLLLVAAAALLARGGTPRRAGWALLVWALLITGVLVAGGLGRDWALARDVARIVTAFGVGVLGVPMLLTAANLRAVAAQPAPASKPAACAGCACALGGCAAR